MTDMVREAVESQYKGKCTITEYQKVTNATTKRTSFSEVTVLENQPCRLSFETIKTTTETDTAASISQLVKLFISPDITVKSNSKLTIIQNGITTDYKNSGMPAVYTNHQEIRLELFKGWS